MAFLCKVVIDSVTVRDDDSTEKYVLNWEYERTSEIRISELTMKLLQSVNDVVTITPGKTIEIWTGFTTSTDKKLFSGFVAESEPENGVVKLVCKDKMWDLIRKNVNTVYEDTGPQAGQISAIASDLIETYGGLTSDVQATGTATGQTVGEFRCDNTDIWERLVALAKAVDFQIWYDAVNDTVHFEPKGYSDSGQTFTVGTEIIGVPRWTNDTSKMVNDLRVDGAVSQTQIRLPSGTGVGQIDTTANFDTDGIVLDKTPENVELIMDVGTPPTEVTIGGTKDSTSGNFYWVDRENKTVKPATGTTFTVDHYAIVNYTWLAPSPIHQISQSSIDTYGSFEKQITLEDIKTVADAESRTAQILATFSIPFLIGNLLLKAESGNLLDVGDRVTIVDGINEPNVNEELVVTRQVVKYPGSNQEVQVGDEALRLADWQMDVETRLKRIEEQLSLKNQDLILELRDFAQGLTINPRYQQIYTRTLVGDGFILNHGEYGVMEEDAMGADSALEVLYFTKQYNNDYEEEFVDTEFKDSSTDATWTNTGSVTF